ncbi:MAG: hypothetical protein VW443_00315 [Pseudomonadales bacterium]
MRVSFAATQYVESYLQCDVCHEDIASEDVNTGYPLYEQSESDIQENVDDYWRERDRYDENMRYDEDSDRFFCDSCWHERSEPSAPEPNRVEWVRANQEALLLGWQQNATNYLNSTHAHTGEAE